jgi:hypothetical protein
VKSTRINNQPKTAFIAHFVAQPIAHGGDIKESRPDENTI